MNQKELIAIFRKITQDTTLSREDIVQLAQNVLDTEDKECKTGFHNICKDLGINDIDGRHPDDLEKEIISKTLIKFNKDSSKASEYLHIGRATFYYKRKKYGI